ncbi:MAG: hypothetical protein LBL37_08380 [Gracilibacteraceae bacterium]|nr:hypothetical protein [Gracilibacteraceae bacterium]
MNLLSPSAARIRSPELYDFTDPDGQPSYGANQTWYATEWQRRAGCGPTVFAHLVWYIARTREKYASLCPYAGNDTGGFLPLMEDAWRHITPGKQGVNKTAMFAAGAVSYGAERNVPLRPHVREIPAPVRRRPPLADIEQFITGFLTDDLPVAFLNLSNGLLTNLDSWHWVTLIAYETAGHTALMYDQSRSAVIDIGLWLRTTAFGGGFVAVVPSLELGQPNS